MLQYNAIFFECDWIKKRIGNKFAWFVLRFVLKNITIEQHQRKNIFEFECLWLRGTTLDFKDFFEDTHLFNVHSKYGNNEQMTNLVK